MTGATSRRKFLQGSLGLVGLSLLAGCDASPPWAQRAPRGSKVPRIGWLVYGDPPHGSPFDQILLQSLRELGCVEGQNVVIEYRHARGQAERLPELAAELVSLNVDVMLGIGGDVATAIKQVTSTIPVVIGSSADPVEAGLAASLARPGGNFTGITYLVNQLGPKRLELLQAIMPGLARVAVIWNPNHVDGEFQELKAAAQTLNLHLQSVPLHAAADFDGAVAAASSAHPEALVAVPSRLTAFLLGRLIALAAQRRWLVVSGWREFADGGGLLTYGPDRVEATRHLATYVDKILRGTRPQDLPISQPSKFDLVINRKTAQALGLTIPQSVLLQATEVIQ